MKAIDLLIPRVQVEINYPENPYKIGDILTLDEKQKDYPVYGIIGKFFITKEEVDKCPEVFRKLHWSEYRTKKELPEYLIVKQDKINTWRNMKGHVIKCGTDIFWNSNKFGYDEKTNYLQSYGGIWIDVFNPITKEEYDKSDKK